MQYKIYFNNQALVLTGSKNSFAKNKTWEGARILENPSGAVLQKLVREMPDGNTPVLVVADDPEAVMGMLKKHLKLVPAAGGLVYNPVRELLLIFRRGKWDLPKGKLDDGEDLEACALREVAEETGVSGLKLEKPLMVTYHTYPEKGELILKESHWYLMQCSSAAKLVPQTDEDIEKCEWVAANRLIPYLDNSHPSIVDVIKEGTKELRLDPS